MIRHHLLLSLSFIAVFLPATVANAETFAAGNPSFQQARDQADQGVQLAQIREAEVYYDQYGRRIFVDPYTGEVLGIEQPRREYRRALREREIRRQDRYYLDDPDDMARFRRQRLDELNRGVAPPVERYPEAPVARRLPPPIEREPDMAPEPEFDRRVEREPLPQEVLPEAGENAPIRKAPVSPFRNLSDSAAKEQIAALQVLLDRKGASPGVIDGRFGDNVDKALNVYEEIYGVPLRSTDVDGIKEELAKTGGPAFQEYTITAEDVAGPFVASIPEDYGKKAALERLSYTSASEALAERFHMDEGFLKSLNPGANFSRPGTIIKVANPGQPVAREVTRIVADKGKEQVRAYDSEGDLVAAYPSTIGSTDTPSPSGTVEVERIAFDPTYTYNPKINFKQGDNDDILTIPPGPNGPVGNVWIALSKPTYGIHGTPEPSKIGKTNSHGCVRLTNWDAQELAKLVKPGATVEFVE